MILKEIRKELDKHSSKQKAKILQRFFKTGPGEYAEGDVFLGVKVPDTRKIAKKYQDIGFGDIIALLKSSIHEERLLSLLILVIRFERASEADKEKIYKLYLRNARYINNWDLVDLSSDKILGAFLICRDKEILYRLAKSKNMWERRISIISTYYFIKNRMFNDTLEISKILMFDKEDLIHKAVGWMLRELGKQDVGILKKFLKKYYKKMPRTMLRYAIEKFPEVTRQSYLKGKI